MAGRPTYNPAVGKAASSFPSRMISAKDQAAHKSLKFRAVPKVAVFRREAVTLDSEVAPSDKLAAILAAEKSVDVSALLDSSSTTGAGPVSSAVSGAGSATSGNKWDDSDALEELDYEEDKPVGSSSSSSSSSSNKYQNAGIDEDDAGAPDSEAGDDNDNDNDDDDDDDSDDEEDEELALHAELEKIKAERAAAQVKREREEREAKEGAARDGALKSNPLVDLSSLGGAAGGGDAWSARVKRRWNDDVVFRNQARDEPEAKQRFINDTIRSDFHKSFLKRFIK